MLIVACVLVHEDQFGAAVHVPAFFRIVVIAERLALADGDHTAGGHALRNEIVLHGVGAALGELQVVSVGADAVGPAEELHLHVRVFHNDAGGFVQDALSFGGQVILVEGEIDAAEDDNVFNDGHAFLAEHIAHELVDGGVALEKVDGLDGDGAGVEGRDGVQSGLASGEEATEITWKQTFGLAA